MADVVINKFTTQILRDGATPSSPGFVVSEGQDPVNPPGTNNFVPYSGAISNVELGEYGLESGFITLDTTPTGTPVDQGTIYWDDSKSTAALIMNGTTQHIGQDTYFYVKNSSGSNIAKGVAVRFDGTDGASGHLLIAPFLADGTYPSAYFMGVTAEAINNGDFGQVTNFGEIEGIDTSIYSAGDLLYASTTSAGAFQTTAPVAPNNIVLIAAAVNSKNNGAIIVRPTYGSNINDDEGVKIVSPTTGDLLQLQASGLWENKTKAQVLGGTSSQFVKGDGSLDSTSYQPLLTNPVTGTGTTNYVPKFTGASTIGNSNLINDSSGNLGLGVTPSAWAAGGGNFQLKNGVNITWSGQDGYLSTNQYYNGSNSIYIANGYSNSYAQAGGSHYWYNAPSGTAGNAISFTQAMTLFSTGNLGIGVGGTDSGYRLDVNGTGRFSGNLYINDNSIFGLRTSTNEYSIQYRDLDFRLIGSSDSGTQRLFSFGYYTSNNIAGTWNSKATINSYTGAATFSSSVTAGGIATNYGTLQIMGGATSASLTVGTAANTVLAFSPGQELAITGNNAAPYGISFQGRNSLAGGGPSGAAYPILLNPLGGNVGIGTTTDAGYKLDVNGTGRFSGALTFAAGDRGFECEANGCVSIYSNEINAGSQGIAGNLYFGYRRTNNLYFIPPATFSSSVTATALTLTSTDSVIATNTSDGSDNKSINISGGGTQSIARGANLRLYGNEYTGEVGNAYIFTGNVANSNIVLNAYSSSSTIQFLSNNTERMRLTSGGFFKASNSSVYQNITSTQHEFNTNQGGYYGLSIQNSHPSAPFGLIVYYPNTINNTSNRFIDCEDNSALRFSVRSNGGLANYQANDVNLSDERTKKDIAPLESYWNKFKDIEIVKFKYKDQTHDDYNIGVIAQQVEQVAPEFVDVDGWGEIVEGEEPLKSIYTADLHHATIKVLQEAMQKIEALQQEIDTLKNN